MLVLRGLRWRGLGICSLLLLSVLANACTHNASFIPDAILHVTAQNFSLGGIQRLTTLVNGSVPGPQLRIPEGEVAWIRVYNDMQDQNLTMVSEKPTEHPCSLNVLTTIQALAWSCSSCGAILRWNTACKPMANPSQALV